MHSRLSAFRAVPVCTWGKTYVILKGICDLDGVFANAVTFIIIIIIYFIQAAWPIEKK